MTYYYRLWNKLNFHKLPTHQPTVLIANFTQLFRSVTFDTMRTTFYFL
jgi:hypothetical protein